MAEQHTFTDFAKIEENIKNRISSEPSISLESFLFNALKESGFEHHRMWDKIVFHNRLGAMKKPAKECMWLEIAAYTAMEQKSPLPQECMDCRKIILHPKKDIVSYASVFSAVIDNLAREKWVVPVLGSVPIASAQKTQSTQSHGRITLSVHDSRDLLSVLHNVYTALIGAEMYKSEEETPLFAVNFMQNFGSLVYVRNGCAALRSFAKQLNQFERYFSDETGISFRH